MSTQTTHVAIMSTANYERAECVADDIARLIALSNLDGELDECCATIDSLVGYWSADRRFVWPQPIADRAHLPHRGTLARAR